MEEIYTYIIFVWNYLKSIYQQHPTIITLIGALILLPIITSTKANNNEGKRIAKKDLREKIDLANKYMDLEKYEKAIYEYDLIESRIKNKKKKSEILIKHGKCYSLIAEKGINVEENLRSAIYYFETAIKLLKFRIYKGKYEVYFCLANTYLRLSSIRKKDENLKQAISMYKKSLILYRKRNKKTYKTDYYFIKAEIDLATSYENLAEVENQEKNLEVALFIYMNIDKDNEEMPKSEAWRFLNNLGRVYEKKSCFLDENKKKDMLQDALKCYNEALSITDVEKSSANYALVSNNIGNIYLKISEIEKEEENLEEALIYYNSALEIYTPDKYVKEYGMTKNNMGSINAKLFKINRKRNYLEECIECHQESLKYRTIEKSPIGFARTSVNLGVAYLNRGREDKSEDDIKLAINTLKDALKIFKPNYYTFDYIKAQNNLCLAYIERGNLTNNKKDYITAKDIYIDILKIDEISNDIQVYNITLRNMYDCYINLFDLIEDGSEGLALCKEALEYFNQNKDKGSIYIYSGMFSYDIYLETYSNKDLKLSIYEFKSALKFLKDNSDLYTYAYIHMRLGLCYWYKNNIKKVKKHFRKSLNVFSENKYKKEYYNIINILKQIKVNS